MTGDEIGVELILARKDVDVNQHDDYGKTALAWAVTPSVLRDSPPPVLEVLKLLLSRPDIDIHKTVEDKTPLDLAIENDFSEGAELLRQRAKSTLHQLEPKLEPGETEIEVAIMQYILAYKLAVKL